MTTHAQNAPAPASPTEPVLATYVGGSITRADFERVIAAKVKPVRLLLATDEARKQALLESMVEFELLLQEAERRGYADHPAVKVAMRKAAVDQLIQGPLTVLPESLPKADVEAAYKARAAELNRPEQRRARHVVLATEAEALALISEAKKAGAGGSDLIAQAARDKSLDEATKRQSGELGYFFASGERVGGTERIAAELAQATFELRKDRDIAPSRSLRKAASAC